MPTPNACCANAQVVARCGRITDHWGSQIPEWIDTAEAIIKAGLEQVGKGRGMKGSVWKTAFCCNPSSLHYFSP